MPQNTVISRYLYAAIFFSLAVATARSQSTVDGAIGGGIYDPANKAVPGAAVDVRNQATDADLKATTDKTGYFRALHLQPGLYTVTITMPGFATYTAHDVLVEVGDLTELTPAPHLTLGDVAQNVNVTDEQPSINTTSNDVSTVLDKNAIDNLPINGRRWSDFTLLTPGVVANSAGYGLLSFRGISVLLNNNTIDGADNNQAYFSEERGRTRAGYSTSQASILEYQVNTSNYSAEYGRSAGGVVNVVTRSGTNAFHGELYFYDRDVDLGGALNPFNTLTTQVPGTNAFVTNVYQPTDWRKIWGGVVGGPIIKDKLFFFYAYDQYRRNFPATAKVGSPAAFFATPDLAAPVTKAGVTTTCTGAGANAPNTLDGQVCSLQSSLKWVSYQYAATQYISGLQEIANGDLGMVPRVGNQEINFPKLDWQVNSRNHVSFEYNRFRWDGPGAIQQTASADVGKNDYGNDFVKIDWGVARLVTVLNNSMTNELRYQYGRELDDEYANKPNAYESQIQNSFGVAPRIELDGSTGADFGNPDYLDRIAYPDERRNQVADTVNWSKGKHAIKFGEDFNHVNDLSNNLQYQKGSFDYPTIYTYLTDYYSLLAGTPKASYSSYTQGYGPLIWDFSTNDYAFFAQDDWRITPKLSLSLGVRYEYEQLPSAPSITPLTLGTAGSVNGGFMPSDKNNIGPRIGFAYNVFGNSQTVIRGGYGVFYGRIINSTIFQAYAFNGNQPGVLSQTEYVVKGATFPQTVPFTAGTPSAYYFNPNFQNPQVHQFDLLIEQQMGWGTVFSLGYLSSLGRQLPGFLDQNLNPAAATQTTFTVAPSASGRYGPLGATTYTTPVYGTKFNNNLGKITDIFSGVNSNYQAMVVQVTHRLLNNLQFYASYTWAHALDYDQNEATFADANDQYDPRSNKYDYANSIYDIPNRVIADAIYTEPAVFHGPLATVLNGWGISPLLQMQNGLPYSGLTTGTPAGGLYGSINGSGGTTTVGARGLPGTGRNTYRLPITVQTDVKLWKDFQFHERYRLELLCDLFNVANHLNITQQNTTEYIISGTTLTYQDAFGSNQNADNNSIYTPRQVEIGARLKF
jgi:hypothetical protein